MKETICYGCMEEYEGSNTCPYCGYDQNSKVKEFYYLEPGNILKAKYLIGRGLGYDGFTTTYMGMDLSLERKVAIKEYMPSDCAIRLFGETKVFTPDGNDKSRYEAQLRFFIEEARELAKLQKEKAIVNVYDFFLENNTGYIVREYIAGGTLQRYLKEKQRLPYQDAAHIILQVLNGLKAMHTAGIIYSEVKPNNILLTGDCEVKLNIPEEVYLISSDHFIGGKIEIECDDMAIIPRCYSAPEQFYSNSKLSYATDVYGAAATLYHMITGQKPREADQWKLKNVKLQKPSEFGIGIPKGLENAILKGLHIRKEDRYQTVDEFIMAIEEEIEKNRRVIY